MLSFLLHLALFLIPVFFLLPPKSLAAITLSVSNTPSTIDYQQDFSIDTNLSCSSSCSDSYLRGVFYPDGTKYFGFTKDNNNNWNNATANNCNSFFKVLSSDLQTGSWSGKLQFKVDKDSAYYDGPGEYFFKLGRYTASCGSPIWSNEITIAITGPTPTPTPSATPTPSPSSTASPTPSATVDLTYLSSNKSTSTSKPSPPPTLSPLFYGESSDSSFPDIPDYNISSHGSFFATEKPSSKQVLGASGISPFIFAIGGGLIIILAAPFIFIKHFKEY